MEKFASADYTVGQLNAIVKRMRKQGGFDGVEKFLRGELVLAQPNRPWREENGIIYITVTSDGTTGTEWITRFERKECYISALAKTTLLSKEFKPTSGVTTEVAVLKGVLFAEGKRYAHNVYEAAKDRSLKKPNAEVSCLIRDKFTDDEIEAMGIASIIIMHDPIKDSEGDPQLFAIELSDNDAISWLKWSHADPGIGWLQSAGFAFGVS